MLYAIEHKGKIVGHIDAPPGENPSKSAIVSVLNEIAPTTLTDDQCFLLMFGSCYGHILDSTKIIATVFRS